MRNQNGAAWFVTLNHTCEMNYQVKISSYEIKDRAPVFLGSIIRSLTYPTIKAAQPLVDKINRERGVKYNRASIIKK